MVTKSWRHRFVSLIVDLIVGIGIGCEVLFQRGMDQFGVGIWGEWIGSVMLVVGLPLGYWLDRHLPTD
jgi:hypothetical protein